MSKVNLKRFESFDLDFNPSRYLDWMFDIPEKLHNDIRIMLSVNILRFSELRFPLYESDLINLEDFSVIINIHSEGVLGTYIVHNDWIRTPFLDSDDFKVCFTISDYKKAKENKTLSKEIIFIDELEKFKNNKDSNYNWYKKKENSMFMELRTKWTIVTYDDKPISMISDYDSNRFMNMDDAEKGRYSKFRVQTIEEGLEYLKG